MVAYNRSGAATVLGAIKDFPHPFGSYASKPFSPEEQENLKQQSLRVRQSASAQADEEQQAKLAELADLIAAEEAGMREEAPAVGSAGRTLYKRGDVYTNIYSPEVTEYLPERERPTEPMSFKGREYAPVPASRGGGTVSFTGGEPGTPEYEENYLRYLGPERGTEYLRGRVEQKQAQQLLSHPEMLEPGYAERKLQQGVSEDRLGMMSKLAESPYLADYSRRIDDLNAKLSSPQELDVLVSGEMAGAIAAMEKQSGRRFSPEEKRQLASRQLQAMLADAQKAKSDALVQLASLLYR